MASWGAGDGLFAAQGKGVDFAWWSHALQCEEWHLTGEAFAGAVADIFKCVDQLVRPVVYALLRLGAFPVELLGLILASSNVSLSGTCLRVESARRSVTESAYLRGAP